MEYLRILNSNDMNKFNEYVLEHGVNHEINGGNLLYWAVYGNKLSFVERLIELGANPNQKTSNGTSSLSVACYFDFAEITRLLIENHAQIHSNCIESAYYGWDGHIQVGTLCVLQEYGWINLYVDDLRDIPEGFVGARTVEEAISLMEENKVHILSFDYELGLNSEGELRKTGYELIEYICAKGIKPANKIYIHAHNIVAKEKMFERLKAFQEKSIINQDIEIYPFPIVKNR